MRKGSRWLLLVAGVYALVLAVAAFWVPLYSGEGSDGSTATATLVDVNGTWGVIVAIIPLGCTALVAALLHLAVGHRAALVAAWVAIGLFGAFTLLGLLTIGAFLLPVVALLLLAASFTSGPTPGAVGVTASSLAERR